MEASLCRSWGRLGPTILATRRQPWKQYAITTTNIRPSASQQSDSQTQGAVSAPLVGPQGFSILDLRPRESPSLQSARAMRHSLCLFGVKALRASSSKITLPLWSACHRTCTISRPVSMSHMSTSTMKPSDQTSNMVSFHAIDGVEEMGRYSPGGYHPVSIGDKFNNRYRVVHKLGHGSYSTVWLARDERVDRLVALKVCTADASDREANILLLLGSHSNPSNTTGIDGKAFIPVLLNTFCVKGPHGTHTCLVTDFARCTLDEARRRSWGRPLQLPVARAMAAQFVLAVSYLHQKGYVHGDLHVGNILMKHLERLDHLSDHDLYKEFEGPECETVETFDNKPIPENVPKAAILPLSFPVRTNELSTRDAHILLGDLGEAYRPSEEQRLDCRTPVHCRPPENLFQPSEPRSFPSDVWTLACSIWGIVGSLSLFESFMPSEESTTAMQVEVLGKLPSEWWAQWEARPRYFTEDGRILENDRSVWDWEFHFEAAIQEGRRRRGMNTVDEEEKEALLAMLKPMLTYKPEDRASVGDVLQSRWMTDWAMPAYKKL